MTSLDTTIKYTGPNIESLGIINGMKLSEVLSAIFKFSTNSNDPIIEDKEIYTDNITHKRQTTSGLSANGILFQTKKATYSQSIVNDDIIISFDYSEVYENSPEGFYVKEPKTRFVGALKDGNTVIRETNEIVGMIQVPLSRIPGFIETEINVGSENGDMIMRLSVPVSQGETEQRSLYFDITDYTNAGKELILSEYLNYIANNVDRIIADVAFIKKYKKGNTVGLIGIIEELYLMVEHIKEAQSNSVIVPGTNTTVSLQEMINHLYKKNDPITAKVESLLGFVNQMTDQTLPGFVSTGKKVVLFYTDSCSNCQEKISEFESIASSINSYIFAKIDISQYQSIGQTFKIIENPTVIIFDSGIEVERVNILSLEQKLNNI